MKRLRLYSRPACELCEALEDALYANWGGQFELDWRDVDRDPQWRERYGLVIPVLTDDQDRELCRQQLDVAALQRYLNTSSADSSV